MNALLSALGKLMIIVAILAVSCAATIQPSPAMLTAVLYIKLGLVLHAAFRCRYGASRSRAWWFGFAVCAAGVFAMAVPQAVIPPPIELNSRGYFNLRDLAGTIATQVYFLSPARFHPYGAYQMSEAIRLWLMLGAGFLGGSYSVWLERDARRAFLENRGERP